MAFRNALIKDGLRLVAHTSWFHPTYGLMVRLLGTTGLRVGELAALNVGDVHILGSRGTLTVRRTYDARYGLSASPKTSRSNRIVTLVPSVVPALAAYLVERRALSPDADTDAAPLFLARVAGGAYMNDWAPRVNPLLTPEQNARNHPSLAARPFDPAKRFDPTAFYKRIWTRAIKLADVEPLRVHDLRHTAVALMLSSGMPITMVSRQLGHSSTSTTDLIYGGLPRESLETAVDDFGDWYATQVRVRH